ncbi:MAG: hypothetical protein FMNOHCHN_00467 [Ignavibacteriaceae bacterium]|nr:hypothetical protein [Ignavibacteriaceae bacterium]
MQHLLQPETNSFFTAVLSGDASALLLIHFPAGKNTKIILNADEITNHQQSLNRNQTSAHARAAESLRKIPRLPPQQFDKSVYSAASQPWAVTKSAPILAPNHYI